METDKRIDDYFHHWGVCTSCGHGWWRLHCPHDNYQNPCPKCAKKPQPISGKYDGCQCPLVMPVDETRKLLDEVDSSSLELTVKSFCACICHNPKDPCDECKGNHKDPSLEKPHHKEGYDGSDLVGSVASPEKCTLSGCLVVKGTHLPAGKKCLHKHTPDTCEHPYPVDCEKCQDLLARLAAYHAMGGLDKNTSLHGEIEKHLDPQPKCECRSGKLHYANCPEHGFGTKKETPLSKLPSSRIKELVENRNGTMNRAKDWEWVKAILEYLDETHEGK